jgi:hypothetical protein
MEFNEATLRSALRLLGRLLAHRGHHFHVVIVGGSALLLGGWVRRPTIDVDVVALEGGGSLVKARPLPVALVEAAEDVAVQMDLPGDWINPGPTDLLDWGLPEGFADRLTREPYGGLTVAIAGRFDLVCLKLYAVADQGPTSRHLDDLRALDPQPDELERAARWCRTQDPSIAFDSLLRASLRLLGDGAGNGGE